MHAGLRRAGIVASAVVITLVGGGAASAATRPGDIAYGSNPAAGNTFVFNGTR